jgi:hypothetical protein
MAGVRCRLISSQPGRLAGASASRPARAADTRSSSFDLESSRPFASECRAPRRREPCSDPHTTARSCELTAVASRLAVVTEPLQRRRRSHNRDRLQGNRSLGWADSRGARPRG